METEKIYNTAYGYVRVSHPNQIEGDGFDRQEAEIKRYAKAKGITIQNIYKEAYTGTEADRPAFQEMVTDILKNGTRTIIIEGMDRLARELQIQTALISYLASKNITLISARTEQDITEAMLNDPMQRALVQIQGVFSELEKGLLVKKLRSARERKKAQTGKCEGRKAYSEVYPELVAEIKKLRKKPKLGRRLPFSQVAIKLNEAGLKSMTGKDFNGRMVQDILRRLQ